MARQSRLEVLGMPHLVSLRGNNGQNIFFAPEDYAAALQFAQQALAQHAVQVHAFCFLPDAMYWLLTPQQERALSLWVQQFARCFVRSMNQKHGRSGTLFEGRFRSGVLQPESHLLPCMWAMDALPVHAGLVTSPAQYAYSSAWWYSGLAQVPKLGFGHTPNQGTGALRDWLTVPDAVWRLGNTPFERESTYVRELEQQSSAMPLWWAELHAGWAVGSPRFLADLQEAAQRRVQRGARGRPRKLIAP